MSRFLLALFVAAGATVTALGQGTGGRADLATGEALYKKADHAMIHQVVFGHTGRFTKSHRFSIAVRLENECLDLLDALDAARESGRRLERLQQADRALSAIRRLMRLSVDLKFITVRSYEHGRRQRTKLAG